MGHGSEAVEAIDTALRLDPNNATAYVYRGLARVAMSQTADAEADFRHALELDPGNQTAVNGLAALAGKR